MQMCKIQDGGRPPFWKSFNRHISVKNRPIMMKFGILHLILNPITVTWPKVEIFLKFKMERGSFEARTTDGTGYVQKRAERSKASSIGQQSRTNGMVYAGRRRRHGLTPSFLSNLVCATTKNLPVEFIVVTHRLVSYSRLAAASSRQRIVIHNYTAWSQLKCVKILRVLACLTVTVIFCSLWILLSFY